MTIKLEHRLLLQAALLDGHAAADAWRHWRTRVDIDLIDEPTQRLLPLLARRLADLAPDDAVRTRVRGLYRHAWVRNHVLWRDARPVITALRRAGVPVVLLKGLSLLAAYGHDWGARPMYDVDFAVPTDRVAEAIELVTGLGWTPEQGQSAHWVRWRAVPRERGWGFAKGDGRIDLHWHVLAGSLGPRADDGFWRRARPFDMDGCDAHVLDPGDVWFHVVTHGAGEFNAPPIQWIADAVLVARASSAASLCESVTEAAQRHGEVATCCRAIDVIADVVGSEPLAPLRARLQRVRPAAVERLRVIGRTDSPGPLGQLARRAAGGTGLLHGARSLVTWRLELPLSERPWAMILYAASGRSARMSRLLRRSASRFVRVPSPAPPLEPGDILDFTRPSVLDERGATGWAMTHRRGAASWGSESRLVLPLGDGFAGRAVVVELGLESRRGERIVEIVANETVVARATVDARLGLVRASVPAEVTHRFAPFEVAVRAARRPLRARGSSRITLRHVELAVLD
jgi:hypothetical protein